MSELPSTYKACVYDEPGKISTKVVDLDMPEPGPGEVLINLCVHVVSAQQSFPDNIQPQTPPQIKSEKKRRVPTN
jgi:hypothetical protein